MVNVMLHDKVLVIIGGTTGLGLSAAKACVAASAKVVVVGRNPGGANGIGADTNSDITNPSHYDVLGRRYYVGATVSF